MTSVTDSLQSSSFAVCVSVSKLYLRSPSWYSSISALIFIPKEAKMQRNRILKVNTCFIAINFWPTAPPWRLNGYEIGIPIKKRTWSSSCHLSKTKRKIRLRYRYGLTASAPVGVQLVNDGAELVDNSVITKSFMKKHGQMHKRNEE